MEIGNLIKTILLNWLLQIGEIIVSLLRNSEANDENKKL